MAYLMWTAKKPQLTAEELKAKERRKKRPKEQVKGLVGGDPDITKILGKIRVTMQLYRVPYELLFCLILFLEFSSNERSTCAHVWRLLRVLYSALRLI